MIIHIVTKKQRGLFVIKARCQTTGENLLKCVLHSDKIATGILYAFTADWYDKAEIRLDNRAGIEVAFGKD